MSDRAIPSFLTNLLSELGTFGSRHDDSSIGANFPTQFDDIDGSNPSTKFISQMEQSAQSIIRNGGASLPEIMELLSANAESVQYAVRKLQNGINGYRAAQELGKKDTVGGFVRLRAFDTSATPIPDVQSSKGGISTGVDHNGGTFGTVGTGGIVKKPTTSIRPRPTTAAFPSHNPSGGVVGEEGDMKPSTTSTKPKAVRRPAIRGLSNGIGALCQLSGRDSRIH